MSLTGNIVLNTFSILLLLILCVYCLNAADRQSGQHRLYIRLLLITMLLLGLDVIARFDGNAFSAFPVFNQVGNFLLFALNPVLPSLWVAYAALQTRYDEGIVKKALRVVVALNLVNTFLVIVSQYLGWYYYIDSGNVYHRGPFYILSHAIMFVMLLGTQLGILQYRKRIDKRVLYSLLFFPIPPFIGVILQIFFYGIPFALNAIVISLLIVLLYVQDDSIYTDHLTGVGNRKKLEAVLKEKVAKSSPNRTFSFIMLDIDNFKTINDTHGHETGDVMLKAAADLLKKSVRANDYVTRYGGDEFCLILDTSDREGLERVADRINRGLSQLNESGAMPYKLSFSMGCEVYDFWSRPTAEAFVKRVDMLMYENKRSKNGARPADERV